MPELTETAELAALLRIRLCAVPREGLSIPETTTLITEHVVGWARDQGWRPEREVRARIARQTRSGPRRGRLDLVCQRPGGLSPVAIEIDRSGKVWSLRKLIAEADAGAVALWVRWRGRTRVALPAEVGMVDISGTSGTPCRTTIHHSPAAAYTAVPIVSSSKVITFGVGGDT